MPRSAKSPPAPPTAETCAEVLRVIRAASEPQTAKLVVKALQPPHKLTERQLVPVLEGYVSSGVLFQFPGKTAKGQPRFWDRNLSALARAAILESLPQLNEPITVRDLSQKLAGPLKFSEAELSPIIDELLATGILHRIPAATAKSKPRIWSGDISKWGGRFLSKTIAAKGPQSRAALRKAVKWLSDQQFEVVLQQRVESKAVWLHPPWGKVKHELFGSQPPTPELYLHEVSSLLTKAVTTLLAVHVSPADLRRAIVEMIEEAGVSIRSKDPERVTPQATSADRTEVDLVALMKHIEPGAARGALVSSRDLRRASPLGKMQFDQTVLDLARQGVLSLHRHDYVTSLSTEERDALVADGAGNYYVGMALRNRNDMP